MKYFIDENKTFPEGLLFMGVSEWRDYKTEEFKGAKVKAVDVASFEKIIIKIKDIEITEFEKIELKTKFKVDSLEINFYVFGQKKITSFQAKGIHY